MIYVDFHQISASNRVFFPHRSKRNHFWSFIIDTLIFAKHWNAHHLDFEYTFRKNSNMTVNKLC